MARVAPDGPPAASATPSPVDVARTLSQQSRTRSKRGDEDEPEPDYAGRALGCFDAEHPMRALCIALVDDPAFDKAVIALILLNCVFLASWDPLDEEGSTRNQVLDAAELVFQIVFTVEMAIKVVARGLIRHKTAYLRDGWNRLDSIVVVSGWVGLASRSGSVSSLRVLRVLRPLRTISGIPGLRAIVSALMQSAPQLLDVMLLCTFSFFIFGIVGVQLFAGRMQQVCYSLDTGEPDFASGELCSRNAAFGRQCPAGFECRVSGHSPNHNITHFDNILAAMLTIFQCITLEGWVDVMYSIRDTASMWSDVYFVFLIWFGSLFVLNLLVAVIYSNFNTRQPDPEGNPWFRSIEGESRSRPVNRALLQGARRMSGKLATTPGLLRRSFSKRGATLLSRGNSLEGDSAPATPVAAAEDPQNPGLSTAEGADRQEPQPQPQRQEPEAPEPEPERQEEEERPAQLVAVDTPRSKLRRRARALSAAAVRVIEASWFRVVVTLLIIANTAVLSIEHYNQPEEMTERLEIANYFFALVFLLEMVAKLLGLGVRGYLRDPFNTFDGLVVVVSFVELLWGGGGGVSALRAVRLLRVFKLARSWKSLQLLLHNMGKSLRATGPFLIVLLLFMFIFALLGMQLFGNKLPLEYDEYGNLREPRSNYDSLLWSMVTTFQIFTGENWTQVLYMAMDATTPWAACYFVLVITIGTYIILSLFLAILIDNFAHEEPKKEASARADGSAAARVKAVFAQAPRSLGVASIGALRRLSRAVVPRSQTQAPDRLQPTLNEIAEEASGDDEASSRSPSVSAPSSRRGSRDLSGLRRGSFSSEPGGGSNHDGGGDDDDANIVDNRDEEEQAPKTRAQLRAEALELVRLSDALWGLAPEHPVRRLALRIIFHSWYDTCMLTVILVSCVLLALDEPGGSMSDDVRDVLHTVDVAFNLFFVAELVVKVVALGLYQHAGSYWTDSWNRLDALIVVAWGANLAAGGGGGAVSALRALRALRPLRLVHRLPGLKVVINAMLQALPPCGNVAVVAMLFFLIFGIMGYYFFGGKFYRCSDPTRTCNPNTIGVEDCPEELWCVGEGRVWANPRYASSGAEYSFDNVALAMLTLFEVATLEMWLDVMYSAVDVTQLGHAPERNANPWAIGFFVSFIAVVNFFILNLFVSVVIENFDKIKKESKGVSAFMTEEQKEWVRLHRRIRKGDPVVGEEATEPSPLYRFVTSTRFELAIMACIMLNVVVMASTHYGQSEAWDYMQGTANLAFGGLFLAEALLKVYAMGWARYWYSSWNRFDFCVVAANLSLLVVSWSLSDIDVDLSLLRIVRVGRVLRLAHSAKSLRILLQTLYYSLPSLGNVGSLLFLCFFIYSVAGMALFGDMPRGEFVNDDANFETFHMSMLTLFRMTTGESWNAIMHDCQLHTYAAVPYFVSFMVLASSIMLNLFVAVILENFDDSAAPGEEDKPRVSKDDLHHFNSVWLQLRVRGEPLLPELRKLSCSLSTHTLPPHNHEHNLHYMPAFCLKDLVVSLSPPIGLDENLSYSHGQLLRVVSILGIPMTRDGFVHYYDTLASLAVRLFPSADARIRPHTQDSDFTVDQLLAAVVIASAWKRNRHRAKIERGLIPESQMGRTAAERLLNARTQLVDQNATVDPLLLESLTQKSQSRAVSPAGSPQTSVGRDLQPAAVVDPASLPSTLAVSVSSNSLLSSPGGVAAPAVAPAVAPAPAPAPAQAHRGARVRDDPGGFVAKLGDATRDTLEATSAALAALGPPLESPPAMAVEHRVPGPRAEDVGVSLAPAVGTAPLMPRPELAPLRQPVLPGLRK